MMKDAAYRIIHNKNHEIEDLKSKIANFENILSKSHEKSRQDITNNETESHNLAIELQEIKAKQDTDLKLLEERQNNEKIAIQEQYQHEIDNLKNEFERAKERRRVYAESSKKATDLLNWSKNGPSKPQQKTEMSKTAQQLNDTKAQNILLSKQLQDLEKDLRDLLRKQRELLSTKSKSLETKITEDSHPSFSIQSSSAKISSIPSKSQKRTKKKPMNI